MNPRIKNYSKAAVWFVIGLAALVIGLLGMALQAGFIAMGGGQR